MEIGRSELRFDGRDPIQVFHFLSRFVIAADTLEVNEARAFVALQQFLWGFCLEQYHVIYGSLTADEG